MRRVFNVTNKEIRRGLRNNATEQERKLWHYLKNKKLGYKFRRQQGIGRYVVDFYCHEKRLVIEIDGSHHVDDYEYDNERTSYFSLFDIHVIRFWNSEVEQNIEGVLEKIRDELVKYHHPRLCEASAKQGLNPLLD